MSTRFELGELKYSWRLKEFVDESEFKQMLKRHSSGDWGNVTDEVKERNKSELSKPNGRLVSNYTDSRGTIVGIFSRLRVPDTSILVCCPDYSR